MVPSQTSVWILRVLAGVSLPLCLYSLWRVTVRAELPDQLLGSTFIILYLLLGMTLSGLSISLTLDPSNLISKLAVYVTKSLKWLFAIPLSLSLALFYGKKLEVLPEMVEHQLYFESDLTALSALYLCLLLGIHGRAENAVVLCLFPITMAIACACYHNVFGTITALIFIGSVFSDLAAEPFRADPLPATEFLFREISLTLKVVIFACAAIWKCIEWNSGSYLFIQNSLFMVVDDYVNNRK